MATLETLRNKAGVFISILIGLALLAFIVNADTLSTARAIFSSDDDMGVIDGTTVSRQDFESLLNYNTAMYKLPYQMTGQDITVNEQMNEYLRNATWQEMIQKYVLEKEYDKLGLAVSDAELTDVTVGANISPIIRQYFASNETGEIDRALLSNFVQNMDGEQRMFWVNLEKQVREQQMLSKYTQLDIKSNYVNSLDVEHTLNGEKKNIEFSYIVKNYNTVADSLISFKESDLKNYYNAHKQEFKTRRSRDAEFVTFTVTPSPKDYERVMYKIEALQKQMDTVPAADLPQFVRMNSDVPFAKVYRKKGELQAALDTVVFTKQPGYVLPYYQDGESYNLTGIVEFKDLPDSVRAEHILLDQTTYLKADSIIDLINKGTNFGLLAMQFSSDKGSAMMGGDLGWFAFDRMVRPFSDSCFFNPVGKVMKVITNYGLHIVRTTGAKDINRKVLLATVKKNILPDEETYSSFYSQANRIASMSEGSLQKFRELCASEGLQPYTENGISLDTRTIGKFSNVTNLIHWLYDADEGDISGVIEIDNRKTYVVAALTNVSKAGIAPFEKVKQEIAVNVAKAKKAEYLTAEIAKVESGMTTIDELAEKLGVNVMTVSQPVNFNTSYIPTMITPEYKLLGALSTGEANKLSTPVVGESGVYVYTITSIDDNPQAQTPEAVKTRLESGNYGRSYAALIDKANIVDNRGRFY